MKVNKRKLKMLWRRDVEPQLNAIAIGILLVILLFVVFSTVAGLLDYKILRDVSKFMNSYETERVMAGY